MIERRMAPAEWAMLVTLSVIWGGSFYLYAIALKELPTLTIVFLRVLLGTLALWLFVMAMRLPLPRSRQVWRDFITMGLLNNAIPFSLIIWGQREVASGLAAILNATTPFFTILIANSFTQDEKMSWLRLAGAVIGLVGVAAMIGVDSIAGRHLGAELAIIGAAVSYGFASVFGRRFAGLPPLLTAAGQTTGSSLLLLPLVLTIDLPWRLEIPGPAALLSILGLAWPCTALAYLLYFTILKRSGATNIVLVTFLVPVGAIILGIAFLGEALGPHHIAGLAAITVGLALIDGRLFSRQS
jgi:drug/metabolite transporter (DMT)-like permease